MIAFLKGLLSDYENLQYIYNLISVLSFITCTILSISSFFKSRRKVTFSVIDYKKSLNYVSQFFIYLQNQSTSQICINSISIHLDNLSYRCELIPKKIRGEGDDLLRTPLFPLNLSAKEGGLYFLEFLYCEDIELAPGKKVDFQIHTNRGAIDTTVILGNISYYLHTKDEFQKSQSAGKK